MLKLKELKFQNIGRFTEEQTIKFDGLGNLVQLDGQNNNTGGSSGSGKTTVFNALDYLLGINDTANTVLQSRLTKEGIAVTGLFELDGKPLTISRIKGKLSVDLEGEVTTGSSKLSEERLDQILAMPRHLFRPMLHKRQKEGGFFLQFTPKETHEFLTDCLGLGDLRLKLDIIENKVKELTNLKTQAGIALQTAQAGLQATQSALAALGAPPVKEVDQDHILQLKTAWEHHQTALTKLETEHAEQNAYLDSQRPKSDSPPQLERPNLESVAFDRTAWDLAIKEATIVEGTIKLVESTEKDRILKVKQKINELKIESSTLNYKVGQGEFGKGEAVKLAGEIKKIRDAICPTCEQSWVTETAKTKESELLAKLSGFKELMLQGNIANERLSALNIELIQLDKDLAPKVDPDVGANMVKLAELNNVIVAERTRHDSFHALQAANNKRLMDEHAAKQKAVLEAFTAAQRAAMADFTLKQQALRQTHAAESTKLREITAQHRSLLDAAISKFKNYNDAAVRYESSLKTLKQQESFHFENTGSANHQLAQLDKELLLAEELKRAIKSFASCSFDDALEAIGDGATRIIRNIPNMANATVQLEGTKETKEGKIKEEVNAVISMDGETGINIKSLSGGERSSVDLAVDLAVIDLIESKTGKGIDVFILDEPFTGLDTVSIEMALEVLKNSNLTKKLIIVDHNDTVKEMVESRLVVVRDGTTSQITQS